MIIAFLLGHSACTIQQSTWYKYRKAFSYYFISQVLWMTHQTQIKRCKFSLYFLTIAEYLKKKKDIFLHLPFLLFAWLVYLDKKLSERR